MPLLSLSTKEESVWGTDVPTDRFSSEEKFLFTFEESIDLGVDIEVLRVSGTAEIRGSLV